MTTPTPLPERVGAARIANRNKIDNTPAVMIASSLAASPASRASARAWSWPGQKRAKSAATTGRVRPDTRAHSDLRESLMPYLPVLRASMVPLATGRPLSAPPGLD